MTDGVAREGFDIDLRHGEAREQAFVHVVLRARVEHKSDGACRHTGNVFVEYRQKGRPSGISLTEADWYAFEVDDNVWVFLPTARLRALVKLAGQQGRTAPGGDFNQYMGALIPREWLIEPLAPTTLPMDDAAGPLGDAT